MASSVAIVGPGRLGTALARRLADAGVRIAGFVGRSDESSRRAVQFCAGDHGADGDRVGCRVLTIDDLANAAEVVLISVGDPDLEHVVDQLVRSLAPSALRSRIWLHTSGYHGLAALAPLRDLGAEVAALHPLCPVPDPAAGVRALHGAPATLAVAGSEVTAATLRRLAGRAGLRVLDLAPDVDRVRYHAACALAAGGGTALIALVEDLLRQIMGSADDARTATTALVGGAVDLCATRGPADALSGPIPRGDVDVVAAHLAVLAGDAALPAYRALMRHAVRIQQCRQTLDESVIARLRSQLGLDS